jgi:hypothetical protein
MAAVFAARRSPRACAFAPHRARPRAAGTAVRGGDEDDHRSREYGSRSGLSPGGSSNYALWEVELCIAADPRESQRVAEKAGFGLAGSCTRPFQQLGGEFDDLR